MREAVSYNALYLDINNVASVQLLAVETLFYKAGSCSSKPGISEAKPLVLRLNRDLALLWSTAWPCHLAIVLDSCAVFVVQPSLALILGQLSCSTIALDS